VTRNAVSQKNLPPTFHIENGSLRTLIIGDIDRWIAAERTTLDFESFVFCNHLELTTNLLRDFSPEMILPRFSKISLMFSTLQQSCAALDRKAATAQYLYLYLTQAILSRKSQPLHQQSILIFLGCRWKPLRPSLNPAQNGRQLPDSEAQTPAALELLRRLARARPAPAHPSQANRLGSVCLR
jgi:hypothetical protein